MTAYPRLLFPDAASVDRVQATAGLPLLSSGNAQVRVYVNAAGTTLADILNADESPNPTATLTLDNESRIPEFYGPTSAAEKLWVRIDGGAPLAVYAQITSRLDRLQAAVEQQLADQAVAIEALFAAQDATARSTYVATLGASNGSDDTATIQAALTAARVAGGGYVCGLPGQAYKTTAALTIGSGTTLDMTGCSVTELNGHNDHLVQNYSFANQVASAADAATTSGSNVITTSLGATAVVGQSLVVAGAGGNGFGQLVGIITARTSTTITLGTLDGHPAPATASVTSAAVQLFNRDSNITVIGGTWNLGTNAPSPFGAILAYHADRVTIDIDRFTAGATSRGVGMSDVRSFWIRVKDVQTTSVGVQITGPAAGGRIEYVSGQSTGDDLVALCAADYIETNSTGGDITGVTIGEINARDTYLSVFKVLAGAGRRVDGIKVEGAILGTSRSTICYCGDDNSSPSNVGGTYGTIDFGLIDVISTGGGPLYLPNPNADHIKARIQHDPLPTVGGVAVGVGASLADTNPCRIKLLELSGVATGASNGFVNVVNPQVTIDNLVFDKCVFTPTGAAFAALTTNTTPTVKDVQFRDCLMAVTGQTQNVVKWQTTGTLSRVRFTGGSYSGGNVMVDTQSATTVLTIVLSGCAVSGFGRVAGLYSNTVVWLLGAILDTFTSNLFFIQGGTLTILGSGYSGAPGTNLVQRAGSEVVRVNSLTMQAQQELLTPADGDVVYCKTPGYGNGVGPAVWNAAAGKWKNLYSGLTS